MVFEFLDACVVVFSLVMAVRVARAGGGWLLRVWLVEAAAYAALFAIIWAADPLMGFTTFSFFTPDAGFAGFALAAAVTPFGPHSGDWLRPVAVIGAVIMWGSLLYGISLGHDDKQQGITDADRAQAILHQRVDEAWLHVPSQMLDHPPTLADVDAPDASAEHVERSVIGTDTVTLVVRAEISCEPSTVLLHLDGTTLDVLVVFRRSLFLSPLPSPAPAGGPCRPSPSATPSDLMGMLSGVGTAAVGVDLPNGLTPPTTVRDVSTP